MNAGDTGAAEGATAAPMPSATASPATPEPRLADDAGAPARSEFDVLVRVALSLFAIGFVLWVIFAWSGYARSTVGATEPWHRGGRNFVELTLVSQDRTNLACASNATLEGLHCAFAADGHRHPAATTNDAHVLRPYNTVNGQLLLGAGLWDSPSLGRPLPDRRFTAWCDFEIVGALRSVSLRWAPDAAFAPVDKSLAVGALRNCAIPQ